MQLEYENKLLELDKEKRTVEEEKMLVERYKQLLLKQRDIMIALTSRLNERDETILALQEEADMYSKNHKEIDDQNNELIGRIAYLEGRLNENNIKYERKNINVYGVNNGIANTLHNKQFPNDEIKNKNEQIKRLEEQKEERNRAESFCLKDLLNIVKNFTDTNDRLGFLEGVESVSKKYNLEGKLGNINYLKELNNNNASNNNNNNNINNNNNNNNNKIHKSVDQMIQEKMRLKNSK